MDMKITAEYLNEKFGKIMEEYLKTDDVFKLINDINKIDKSMMAIVLNFVIMHKFTCCVNDLSEQLQKHEENFIGIISDNKDTIDKINNIIKFNLPNVGDKNENQKQERLE